MWLQTFWLKHVESMETWISPFWHLLVFMESRFRNMQRSVKMFGLNDPAVRRVRWNIFSWRSAWMNFVKSDVCLQSSQQNLFGLSSTERCLFWGGAGENGAGRLRLLTWPHTDTLKAPPATSTCTKLQRVGRLPGNNLMSCGGWVWAHQNPSRDTKDHGSDQTCPHPDVC